MRALCRGEVEAFITFLKYYLANVPSFLDTKGPEKELFPHGLLLGFSAILAETHIIASNLESGEGEYDISLTPKDKSKQGVILELNVDKPKVSTG